MDYKAELKKEFKKRLIVWILFLIVVYYAFLYNYYYVLPILILGILLDELIKEGYFFKKSDVFNPYTHEWIMIMILAVFSFFESLKRLFRWCKK